MNELMSQLRSYQDLARRRYDSFADSERLVINIVAFLVVAALIYLIVVAPAQRAVASAEMKLVGKQNLVQWMKQNESLAREAAGGAGNNARTNLPLQSVVTSTAPRMGINVKRFEPESDDKLRIWLEKVPFDKTMSWLYQLEQKHGVKVINISVDSEREEGIVSAKLVLQK